MYQNKYHINIANDYDTIFIAHGIEELCKLVEGTAKTNKNFDEVFNNMNSFTIINFDEEGVSFDTYATKQSTLAQDSMHKLYENRQELLDALYANAILLENKKVADKLKKAIEKTVQLSQSANE